MKVGQRTLDILVATIAVLAPWGAVGALHRLGNLPWLRVGWSDLEGWLALTPWEDAVAAGLRALALAAAYWLAVSTTVYLLALASGVPRLVATARPFTLPAVRRIADRLLAGSLALSTMASPLVGATAEGHMSGPVPPIPVVSSPWETADDHVAVGYLPNPLTPPPVGADDPAVGPSPSPGSALPGWPVPSRGAPPPMAPGSPNEVIVAPGDHLWGIAERRLADVLGRPPTDSEVAPYWVEVKEVNRPRLRSGDPDLVYPGEVVLLPPVTGG